MPLIWYSRASFNFLNSLFFVFFCRTCLTYSDEKVVAYSCMVLFTCLNSEKVRELLNPGNLTVALRVLKVYKEQLESEWSYVSLDIFLYLN